MTKPGELALSLSDIHALRGLRQRNGGALSQTRAERLLLLGLVYVRQDVAHCYPGRAPSYSPTPSGWQVIKDNVGRK